MTETSPCLFLSRLTDTEDQKKYTVGFVQDHVEVSRAYFPHSPVLHFILLKIRKKSKSIEAGHHYSKSSIHNA